MASRSTKVTISLRFPTNMFVVGTVNVDETTYMFSPKVLDRAFTFEIRTSTDELDPYSRPATRGFCRCPDVPPCVTTGSTTRRLASREHRARRLPVVAAALKRLHATLSAFRERVRPSRLHRVSALRGDLRELRRLPPWTQCSIRSSCSSCCRGFTARANALNRFLSACCASAMILTSSPQALEALEACRRRRPGLPVSAAKLDADARDGAARSVRELHRVSELAR